ncbi:coagulation factor XIII A chain-like isoform X2 [Oncorhynchus clarkii lewisi]|uniref:coagulation factor XIII A chain-like isoform X2 n=1 Tax=Oncorhynchus clarkii lewisi TaxID=490388 RepID=UPI0039B9C793
MLGYQFDAPFVFAKGAVKMKRPLRKPREPRRCICDTTTSRRSQRRDPNVEMTLEIPQEPVKRGKNFQMAVVFRNLSEDTRTIHGFLVGSTIYYTNIQRAQFMQDIFDVTMKPHGE